MYITFKIQGYIIPVEHVQIFLKFIHILKFQLKEK